MATYRIFASGLSSTYMFLPALQLFPPPGPKSPIEETDRSDPYTGCTISGDDIARVMHSQINTRKSNHSNQEHSGHPDAELSTPSAHTCSDNRSEYSIKSERA
jgi:hypothetical protein